MLRPRISLRCPRCGSERFRVEGKPAPETVIVCGGCHTSLTYGEVENSTLARVRSMQGGRLLSKNFGK